MKSGIDCKLQKVCYRIKWNIYVVYRNNGYLVENAEWFLVARQDGEPVEHSAKIISHE